MSSLVSPAASHGVFHWTVYRLEIGDIRLFSGEGQQDYHVGEVPIIDTIAVGNPVTINSLVKNQNHTGEHFDYITQVYGKNGAVEYLNVRYGIAVQFGGQLPIDSGTTLIFNDTGAYLVKVFAVTGLSRDNPQLASIPKVAVIEVSKQDTLIIPTAVVSQHQAIRIVEDDLRSVGRNCVCAISPALVDEYVNASNFQSNLAYLPLEFYHLNGTFYELNATNGVIIGKWDDEHPPEGFQQYNGKYGKFKELGKGRLYWILDGYDGNGVPFLYNVDAVTGEILDSEEIRQ